MKKLDSFRGEESAPRLQLAKDSSQSLVVAGFAVGQHFVKFVPICSIPFIDVQRGKPMLICFPTGAQL